MTNGYESSTKTRSVLTEVYTQKRGTCVTVVILGIIIGIFAFAYITFGNEPVADYQTINSTLKLVTIVFKHGQAPPGYTYPNDPYKADNRWRAGLGELTKKGKQNMYSLGKYLRDRYTGFLPELYYVTDMDMLSPNSDACLMSASVLLAGLYPPHKYQVWNPQLLWQPIPVRGVSAEIDNIIDMTAKCPELKRKIKEMEHSIKLQDKELPKLYDYLTDETGVEFNNLSSIVELYNLLQAQEKNNLILPEWTRLVYPEMLLKYAVKSLEVETENFGIAALSTGVLMDKITIDMKDKVIDNSTKKLFLYSAHEKSIVNTLRILDKGFHLKPEFTSAVVIELHAVNAEFLVQAFYLPEKGKAPVAINITECGSPCLFENFSKYIKSFVPKDWNTECKL